MAPSQVNKSNEKQLWKKLYANYLRKYNKPKKKKFEIGDIVILSKKRKQFSKGYLPNWSDEKFMIIDNINTNPIVWRIMDISSQEILKPKFYSHELQKISF